MRPQLFRWSRKLEERIEMQVLGQGLRWSQMEKLGASQALGCQKARVNAGTG